ncbi:MAG TPA: histidine phosphatase family protein [Rhizomicrobium sp.]|nr:histidine phosphatase family protein [Rhizomicrobium sp.]
MSTLPGTTGRRRIYLMRHGHVDYFADDVVRTRNTRDVVLTPQGRMEAEAAGRAFAPLVFDRAICSGLPRTRETAQIVLECFENPPTLEFESDLVEIHGGRIGGDRAFATSRKELVATMSFYFSKAAEEGATMLEGGEAFSGAQARAIAAIKRLLGQPDWKQILIVAHEGINRLVLSWASGAGLAATHAFEQDTGCINVVDFDMVPGEGGKPGPEIERALIKAVNLTPYNYVKHGMNLTSLEAIFARNEER